MENIKADKVGCITGCRMLNIASMNVDTLRTLDSIDSVITNLQSNNIEIACIQETHNNRYDHIERENYTIFYSGGKMAKTNQKY